MYPSCISFLYDITIIGSVQFKSCGIILSERWSIPDGGELWGPDAAVLISSPNNVNKRTCQDEIDGNLDIQLAQMSSCPEVLAITSGGCLSR